MSNDLSRRFATFRDDLFFRDDVFDLRFTPVPDAGVTGGAPSPGGVLEGVFEGVFERVCTPPTILEGMIIRDTPVEYRLRPRERAAIRHDSVRNLNGCWQLQFFDPLFR